MEKDLEQNFHERKSLLILLAIGEKKNCGTPSGLYRFGL